MRHAHSTVCHHRRPTVILLLSLALLASGCRMLAGRPPARRAARLAALAETEIRSGIRDRAIGSEFERYRAYVAGRLDASAGTNTFSDKTGNCRLSLVDYLLRHPIEAISTSESLTWSMHEAARGGSAGLLHVLALAARQLDAPVQAPPPYPFSPVGIETQLVALLTQAQQHYTASIAPLASGELEELRTNLYAATTEQIPHGHSFHKRSAGRRVTDALEKMDRRALAHAAMNLAQLADPALIAALRRADRRAFLIDAALSKTFGGTIRSLPTPVGKVVIAEGGDQTYPLDAHPDICLLIDLDAGDDTYLEGAVSPCTPLLAIIDCGGSNRFSGRQHGIQGAALLGLSLLATHGCVSNRFEAVDVAQGSAMGGVGLLVNEAQQATFTGRARVQGHALGGFGLLLNRAGRDVYHGAIYAQGVGSTLGVGSLIDLQGDDTYFAGGLYYRGYDDSPGYGGWSQGVGVGPRGIANGGLGVLLDGAGDDLYEYDYFSHGGGYWFAAGFVRDFDGHDRRIGATRTMWDGTERKEKRFVRWGVGFGCHYGVGAVIDDAGDDLYTASTADTAFCWDLGTGAILDFGGNDTFEGSGAGRAANAGLALVMNVGGDDTFTGGSFGYANPVVNYHPMPDAGGNFAGFLRYGGSNRFTNRKAQETAGAVRGWAGGFFLERKALPPRLAAPCREVDAR
jgi:hypothetical protein